MLRKPVTVGKLMDAQTSKEAENIRQLKQLKTLRRAMFKNAGIVGGNEFNDFINYVDDIRQVTTKKAFNEVLGSSDMVRAIKQLAKALDD